MEGSARVKPDAQETPSNTYSIGEKIEAIWSTDGEKYPGTIVNVFANDNYEVLFDDGVKSRRKGNLIFKITESPTVSLLPVAATPTPPQLQLKGGRQGRFTAKNNKKPPTLQSVKQSVTKSSSLSTLPPPPALTAPSPPVLNRMTNSRKNSNDVDEDSLPSAITTGSLTTVSVLKDAKTGPPILTPKPMDYNTNNSSDSEVNHKVSKEDAAAVIDGVSTNGSASPKLNNDEGDQSATHSENSSTNSILNSNSPNNSSTKKGFVYVQQPHYSVFDPPPVDLGKRHRRVHNYSLLAKGPVLKKGLTLSANSNGIDELIDGESPTSTPSTSKPNSRCSSPSVSVTSPIINNVNCKLTTPKSAANSAIMSSSNTETLKSSTPGMKRTTTALPLPTPPSAGGSTYIRKRRFLKSPPKTSSSRTPLPSLLPPTIPIEIDAVPPIPTTPDIVKEETTIKKEISATTTSLPIKVTPKTPTSSLPQVPPLSKTNSISTTETTTSTNLTISDNNNDSNAPAFIPPQLPPPPPPPTQPNDSEDVPSKRLRKPSLRFSADEGYVDIFSQQRRTRKSRNNSTSPAPRGRPRISDKSLSPSTQVPAPHIPYSTSPKSHGKRARKSTLSSDSGGSASLLEKLPPLPTSAFMPNNKSGSIHHRPASPNCDRSSSSKSPTKLISIGYDSDEEEELLDIGDYTIVDTHTKSLKKSPTKTLSRHLSGSTIPEEPIKPSSHSKKAVVLEPPTVPKLEEGAETSSQDTSSPLVHQRPLRQTSRGRIVRPPTLKTDILKEPSVVLDRISGPRIQILVEKCDSVIPANRLAEATSSAAVLKSHFSTTTEKVTSPTKLIKSVRDGSTLALDRPEEGNFDEVESESLMGSCSYKNKKWRKKRWGRGRGLLPGIKSGMRVNDSHAMQLLKRSRFQRRFDNRGRPKVVLLKGITKKRLKKIQDSLKRRKLKRKRISVTTKFKDVRVDIINCICGRTDEFGLMVQCEVCLCWQHGNCFKIFDGSKLPRFYVCESCASPKRVRPSYKTEGIRQETYKKGILPSYPFTPRPSQKQQRIIKRCNDLNKMVNSIDNAIRQNRLKELIASTEPEHKKLYQWSAPRVHPKDLIQKWHFNKYYKAVVRRLVIKHKGKLDYMDKFANTVAFREKLKKYSQAFEEAKLAISRKIGSRGLILVEKLSEQESKVNKIHKVKDKLDNELSQLPEAMRNCLMSQIDNSTSNSYLPQNQNNEPIPCSSTTAMNKLASSRIISDFVSNYAELLSSDSEEEQYDDDEIISLPEEKKEVQIKIEPVEKDDTTEDNHITSITNNESAEIAEDIIRFNLEQLNDTSDSPVKSIVLLEDAEEDNWVKMNNKTDAHSGDLIKLMLSKNKSPGENPIVIDIESESEATLSGDTTVSVEDSEGGEEYWYNPITELNCEYDTMRRLLLHDNLIEYDKKTDGLWRCRESRSLKQDWLDELDFHINGDLGLGLDSASDSDSPVSTSDSEEEDDDKLDARESITTIEEEIASDSSGDDKMECEENAAIPYWRRALLDLEHKESTDDQDPTWNPEDAYDSESCSSSDEEESNLNVKPKADASGGSSSSNVNSDGILLVSSDPTVTTVKPGEIVDVSVRVDNNEAILGKGVIIAGPLGQNVIKLINDKCENQDLSNFGNISTSQLSLCKSCQESFGSKWNWKQLNASKGVNIVLEDTLQTLAEEIDRFKHLGMSALDAKICFEIPKTVAPPPQIRVFESGDHKFLTPFPKPKFEVAKLTEICREILSRPRQMKLSMNSQFSTKSAQPASPEEESILSLLSLSKIPVECNGENVSELSIESLRKLTDRLQQNGPLSEDLAKAVTGQCLTNGKIGIQKLDKLSSISFQQAQNAQDPVCVRCQLKQNNAHNLYILITSNPTFVNSEINSQKLHKWCNKISKAVEDVRLSAHVFKRVLFQKIKTLAERKKAEKTARDLGIKVTPDSMKRRLQIVKPDQYLTQLRADYMDALMPYATYFISRFTKKDEINSAKKKWISSMIQHYNNVKKTLKSMYGVENDEGRLQSEDKFYASLDILRKSFDIVLTKKDIKMRRQYPSLSQSDSIPPNDTEGNDSSVDLKPPEDEEKTNVISMSNEEDPAAINTLNVALVNGLTSSSTQEDTSTDKNFGIVNEDMSLLPPPDKDVETPMEQQQESTKTDPNNVDTNQQLQELEILARLANYPIQVEDVNAILGITNETEADKGFQTEPSNAIDANTISTTLDQNIIQNPDDKPLELEDLRLVEENLSLKTDDNLVLGGDMDLINAIGCLGATGGSDLLLNVFDDPMFSDPSEEPIPCSSRNIPKHTPPPPLPPTAPSLAKLTPEMCKGFLLDDIRAHQSIIDTQLDKLEAEIMELERRRGNGLKDKDDNKLFEMLYANMQVLLENTDVLNQIVDNSVGVDDVEMNVEEETEVYEEPVEPEVKTEVKEELSDQDPQSESDSSSIESDYYDDDMDMLFDKTN